MCKIIWSKRYKNIFFGKCVIIKLHKYEYDRPNMIMK